MDGSKTAIYTAEKKQIFIKCFYMNEDFEITVS